MAVWPRLQPQYVLKRGTNAPPLCIDYHHQVAAPQAKEQAAVVYLGKRVLQPYDQPVAD